MGDAAKTREVADGVVQVFLPLPMRPDHRQRVPGARRRRLDAGRHRHAHRRQPGGVPRRARRDRHRADRRAPHRLHAPPRRPLRHLGAAARADARRPSTCIRWRPSAPPRRTTRSASTPSSCGRHGIPEVAARAADAAHEPHRRQPLLPGGAGRAAGRRRRGAARRRPPLRGRVDARAHAGTLLPAAPARRRPVRRRPSAAEDHAARRHRAERARRIRSATSWRRTRRSSASTPGSSARRTAASTRTIAAAPAS